jgi:hypothetical protein
MTREPMISFGLKIPTPSTSVLPCCRDNSHVVYLDKDYHNDKEEIWSWSYDQQQLNNSHTL